jgi:hypothetical protein
MQTIIWALGSMLVLMLIITFLPLGYTIKGKLLITLVGFVLALGGLAIATIFPIWQTVLMLVALIFFVAYLMDSRIRSFLYKESLSFADVITKEELVSNDRTKQEKGVMEIIDSPLLNMESDKKIISSLVPDHINLLQNNENPDEDIAFLFDRKIDLEVAEKVSEYNYLIEIEALLVDEIDDKTEGLTNELSKGNKLNLPSKNVSIETSSEKEIEEESVFEFLFTNKEVASGLVLDEAESEVKLEINI